MRCSVVIHWFADPVWRNFSMCFHNSPWQPTILPAPKLAIMWRLLSGLLSIVVHVCVYLCVHVIIYFLTGVSYSLQKKQRRKNCFQLISVLTEPLILARPSPHKLINVMVNRPIQYSQTDVVTSWRLAIAQWTTLKISFQSKGCKQERQNYYNNKDL